MKKGKSHKPKITPLKKLLFSAVFFLLILLLLEFLLGFADMDKYDHLFMPRSSYPIFVKGSDELAGKYVTNSHFNEFINWQSFPQEKNNGVFRIFVIGGSAAYAWPYTDKYGFTGHLRRVFENEMPGKVELINAAGMSYGSHRVLDVLQDVLLHEPDLVIVYSGNNEYVERNALPDPQESNEAVEGLSSVLGQTGIYRALRIGLFKTYPSQFSSAQKQDITDIRSGPKLERGSLGRNGEIDREVFSNYRKNLTAIRDKLVESQVPGIFFTVPVNIGGWIPTVDEPKFEKESDASRWMELYKHKELAFQSNNIPMEAEYLQEMLSITPNDPGMRFNYGKVLWNLGKYDASYLELVRAKDSDVRPVRALSPFNEFIRTLVDKKKGIFVADLERDFRELYLNGVAESLFIDYCHFTDYGHKIVARKLLPVIQKTLSGELPLQKIESRIMEDTVSQTKNDMERASELYARAITLQNNNRIQETINTYKEILRIRPHANAFANLGNIYLQQGNFAEAKPQYLKALELRPALIEALVSMGLISMRENDIEKAEQYFQKAYRANPYAPSATIGLANVAMRQGQTDRAVQYFEKTLQLGRDNFSLRLGLGDAYLKLGDRENAVRNWKAALKFNPYDKETKELVQKYSHEK